MNKFFFVTAPNSPTGGPTLLHQAAKELIELGFDANMVYDTDNKTLDPVHIKFKNYNIPYVMNLDLIKTNDILVVPEQFNLIKKYSTIKSKKIIWWLSVDNYVVSKFYSSLLGKVTKLFLKVFKGSKYIYTEHFEIARKIVSNKSDYISKYDYQWIQSKYAQEFLKDLNLSSSFVGDYLVEDFSSTPKSISKENIICYSPFKGYGISKKIINFNKDFSFVPIQNMSPSEVSNLLSKSKIYIDFGNHPGQDRIPREARVSDCVVIVGKRGSAINDFDVPISNQYKFPQTMDNNQLNALNTLFKDIFNNHSIHLGNQSKYLDMIKMQKIKFTNDLKKAIEII